MQKSFLNLFPVPLCIVNNFINDSERIYLLDKIKEEAHEEHPAFTNSSFSTHKPGVNFLKTIDNGKFYDRITKTLNEFASAYGIGELKITTSWSNIQNPGSKLIDHMHPNSKISGCIYLNVDVDSSKIYFHNPNPYITFEEFIYPTDYNHHYYWWEPVNNQMLLFPSWLKHGSNQTKNHTEGRISIAFNSELL